MVRPARRARRIAASATHCARGGQRCHSARVAFVPGRIAPLAECKNEARSGRETDLPHGLRGRAARCGGDRMSAALLVLTNLPDRAAAESLAATLIGQRLAACVNILAPCRSVYRWKDAVQH